MICEHPIILGGTGSSGSTLLVTILNRHPHIAAGSELSLFNKRAFFRTPFDRLRRKSNRIARRGICTDGWFLYPKINFEKYGYSVSEFAELINRSKNHRDFVDTFFSVFLNREMKRIWAEKTPSNAYCFNELLELYPEARFIHISRDGRDIVTSFIRRGMNPYFATMLWIYNTAFALTYRSLPNYYELKYEDLVNDPAGEVRKICSFLDVEFDRMMLSASEETKDSIDSWNHSPGAAIDDSSVGKYKSYLSGFHYYAMLHTRISSKHMHKFALEHKNAEEIHQGLGYSSLKCRKTEELSWVSRFVYHLRLLHYQIMDLVIRYYMLIKKRSGITPYPGRITAGRQDLE